METKKTEKMDFTKYLNNIGKDRYGDCKACHLRVYASAARIGSHKRANCKNATPTEIEYFHNLFVGDGEAMSALKTKQSQINDHVIRVNKAQEKLIDQKIANFFFRTSTAMRKIEATSFKEMVHALNPAYSSHVKSAKTLGGNHLNEFYENVKKQLLQKIEDSVGYILVSDGWTNVKHQHIINFMIVLPNEQHPLFFKSIDTSTMTLDKNTMTNLVVEVAKDIGVEKWVGLIVDNANIMQAVCDAVEELYPKVFANGCLAHGLNLFMKNLVDIPKIDEVITKTKKVVKFINNHNKLYHIYTNEIRNIYGIKHGLCLPMDTRFYTFYTHLASVLENKSGLKHLVNEEDEFSFIFKLDQYKEFTKIINDSSFWKNLKFITDKVLLVARDQISIFEADGTNIGSVYSSYSKLYKYYNELESNDILSGKSAGELLLKDWEYMHTSSMGFAHILAPRNFGTEMYSNDYEDTLQQMNRYIEKFYADSSTESENCKKELNAFFLEYVNASATTKKLLKSRHTKSYWAMEGAQKFPFLSTIAMRVFMIPTSSASSERCWSIYAEIHTKKRNRLNAKTQEKLVFVYMNTALLDEKDTVNYLDGNDCCFLEEDESQIEIVDLEEHL